MKIFDYYNSNGSFKIRIEAQTQEAADLLFQFAFSKTKLSYDEWLKFLHSE